MSRELLQQLNRIADFVNEASAVAREDGWRELYKQGLDALGDIDKMRAALAQPADEDEVQADLREDRRYRAGFMSGYSVGVSCERKNDHSEYHARLAKMTVLISDAAHVFIDRETL